MAKYDRKIWLFYNNMVVFLLVDFVPFFSVWFTTCLRTVLVHFIDNP
jgi:hypothetical protein